MTTQILQSLIFLTLCCCATLTVSAQEMPPINVGGFTLLPHQKAPDTFDAGFSMYPTIWSLVETHPGKKHQSGLFGTWMKVKLDTPMDGKIGSEKTGGLGYTSIEGGSGVWRHNRFPTITPKFQMGGVALSFEGIANGPGFGKGRDWTKDQGRYGVAQLSPHLIFPLDGLNYKQGTFGKSIGYGYLPLPLTSKKDQTSGQQVPTGDQSWTLFFNSRTFKGPVAFFTPHFWARHTVEYPHLHGKYFDHSPNKPDRRIQMETQHIAAIQAKDEAGRTFARVTRITFPLDQAGLSHVFTHNTCYNKSALWDSVQTWFEGGPVASGQIDVSNSFTTNVLRANNNNWKFFTRVDGERAKFPIDWKAFAKRAFIDDKTLTFEFDPRLTKHEPEKGRVTLPEFYELVFTTESAAKWVPRTAEDVPIETGLHELKPADFHTGKNNDAPWTTPDDTYTVWKTPGPTAGPFQTKLGDGSTLTYYWYKFNEQPAILKADLTDRQRTELQRRVELLHRHWKPDQNYLPEPDGIQLAEFDPGLLVVPPAGLEIGFVPIATRQEIE